MNHSNAPARLTKTAWLLGLAGLIPFVTPTILALIDKPQLLAAQHQYGACILAFLGAIHWGPALNGSAQPKVLLFTWGVIPSLIAWLALQSVARATDMVMILVLGLTLSMVADTILAKHHRWPTDYLKMRAVLTVVACTSLLLGQFNENVFLRTVSN